MSVINGCGATVARVEDRIESEIELLDKLSGDISLKSCEHFNKLYEELPTTTPSRVMDSNEQSGGTGMFGAWLDRLLIIREKLSCALIEFNRGHVGPTPR